MSNFPGDLNDVLKCVVFVSLTNVLFGHPKYYLFIIRSSNYVEDQVFLNVVV